MANFAIRAAFDPAFAAAKADRDQFNLDRWWDEYAEREAEAIEGFMELW